MTGSLFPFSLTLSPTAGSRQGHHWAKETWEIKPLFLAWATPLLAIFFPIPISKVEAFG